jgi:acyl-CoA reductase-like NAD-dependent aldehyde dehydrogenase
MAAMATWKLLTLAYKARRGWSRIPPAQRRKLLENAGKQARKHGPTIAKHVATAVSEARKRRA